MFINLPDDIQGALNLLWDYADDACASMRTKAECEEEGYDCEADSGYYITFVTEDGIRVPLVTGVQTCALPIY